MALINQVDTRKHNMTKLKAGDPDATINYWGTQEENRVHMVHALRKVGEIWTSKMGQVGFLINHGRDDIRGPAYGEIRISFKPAEADVGHK
jgi:hypothetical protein